MRILVHTAYKLSAPACCPASCIACSIRRSLGEGWKSEEGREPEQPAYSRVVRSRKRVVHVASSRTNPAICTLPSKKWGGDRIASPSRCARQTRGAATAASPLRGSFRTLAHLLTQRKPTSQAKWVFFGRPTGMLLRTGFYFSKTEKRPHC